ncbi:MAG: hypothetical protein HOP34_11950 [Methylococcaceae bacterium]|nr:hypothetical protein [Methylococcaceae bacterium]
MTRHTLHYLGFEAPQQEAIAAILDLAESALTSEWRSVDNQDCDVLIINVDSEDGAHQYQAALRSRPLYQLVAVTEEPSKISPNAWILTKKPHAPPSLKELATLFNEVAIVLAEAAQNAPSLNIDEPTPTASVDAPNMTDTRAPTTAEEDAAIVEPEETAIATANLADMIEEPLATPVTAPTLAETHRPLTPQQYLFGLLLRSKQDQNRRLIKLSTAPALYVSAADNSYYFDGSQAELLGYMLAQPQDWTETIITKAKFNKIVKNQQLSAHPLDALLVEAILKAAGGRLLEGHQPEQKIQIKPLPPLPGLEPYQTIAHLLAQHPMSLYEAAETLHLPLAHVFDFYNVCTLLGHIDTVTSPAPEKTSVLGHFLKALFRQ